VTHHRSIAIFFCLSTSLTACGDSDSSGAGASGTGGTGGAGPSSSSSGGASASACFATFDGADVMTSDVGEAAALTTNFSLAARIRPEELADGQIMFIAGRHTDGGPNGHYLRISNEGGLKAEYIVFIAAATCAVSSPLTLPASGEVHLLGSFDSAKTRIFIDGDIGASADCGEPTVIDPESMLTIGRSSTAQFPFEGSLTDVMYLDEAFTSTFDPGALGCDSGAIFHFSFEGLEDLCGAVPALTLGDGPDADDADPTIACE